MSDGWISHSIPADRPTVFGMILVLISTTVINLFIYLGSHNSLFTSAVTFTVSPNTNIPIAVAFLLGLHLMLCPEVPHFTTEYMPGPPKI